MNGMMKNYPNGHKRTNTFFSCHAVSDHEEINIITNQKTKATKLKSPQPTQTHSVNMLPTPGQQRGKAIHPRPSKSAGPRKSDLHVPEVRMRNHHRNTPTRSKTIKLNASPQAAARLIIVRRPNNVGANRKRSNSNALSRCESARNPIQCKRETNET